MWHDGENRASPGHETLCVRVPSGEASGNSAVCRQTAVYTFKERSQIPASIRISHITWLNQKMLNSEKGLTRKIQPEYAVYITCITLGILSYLE